MSLHDSLGRPLRNLRISVTDRCNLRCHYCMPEEDYVWLPRSDILTFEETGVLVDAFLELGVRRIRLTGGEPLLRRDLSRLIALLASRPRVEDLAMTTNGILLAEQAKSLLAAGLHRVTVSLDTLRPESFRRLTRHDGLDRVLKGLEVARKEGSRGLKIDTVVIRDVNDDEMDDMLDLARGLGAEVRFIEYMDVGGATRWSPARVVSRREILARLERSRGPIRPIEEDSSAPADRFELRDGTVFGIISSTTAPFCASCDRSRLTADGHWYRCLYARHGTDLRTPLREGEGVEGIRHRLERLWSARADRGAEDRLRERGRYPFLETRDLKRDPRLEMHTRGG